MRLTASLLHWHGPTLLYVTTDDCVHATNKMRCPRLWGRVHLRTPGTGAACTCTCMQWGAANGQRQYRYPQRGVYSGTCHGGTVPCLRRCMPVLVHLRWLLATLLPSS